MKVADLKPVPDRSGDFSHRGARSVPETAGCYSLSTFGNEILYVGLSVNLRARCLQHLDSDEKRGVTGRGRAFRFHFLQLATERDLHRVERGGMNQYVLEHGTLPELNKIYSTL